MKIIPVKTGRIPLGKEGENLATRVELPLSGLNICDGQPVLVHQRATDKEPYPVPITQDGDIVVWEVTTTDTYVPGIGRAELRWVGVNGEVIKSRVYETVVVKSLAEPTEPPDVYEGYLTTIVENAQKTEQAAREAEENATRAEQAAEEADFTDTEALAVLVESGLITPAGNGKGGVYTNNGKILVI